MSGGGSDFDDLGDLDDLSRWAGEARVDDAAAERRRSSWLRRQDDESLTLAGLLIDLTERGQTVAVALDTGRRHHGSIAAVGPDLLALDTTGGLRVLLALASVVSVRTTGDQPVVRGGGQTPATDLRFVRAIEQWSGDRGVITVVSRGGETTAGALEVVGRDVLTLRPTNGGIVYVALASVSEVGLAASG